MTTSGGARSASSQEGDMAIQSITFRAGALALILALAPALCVSAQRLPDVPVADDSESRSLGLPAAVAPASGSTIADGTGWLRTGIALGCVVALIVGLKFALTRVSARSGGLSLAFGAGGRSPAGVLEVLGRYPIARGQSLVLLRMDQRVLLLSQTSSGCATLAEVTEPDEVASLLVKTRDEEGASNASRFNDLLHRIESDPTIIDDERGGPAPMESSLRQRLAALSGRGVRA